jgi:ribokinase
MPSDTSVDGRRAVVVGDLMTDVVVLLQEGMAEESDTASQIAVVPGGSASNVAVFLSRGGVATTLVGVVGDDDRGRSLRAALTVAGVATQIGVVEQYHTGTVVSIVGTDGRRSMLTDRGANRSLDPGSVPDELFRPRHHLHLSGYEVIDGATRGAAKVLFARAGAAGMTRSADCSSAAPLRRLGAQAFFEATQGAELLFANGDEARALTGSVDPEVIADVLSPHYATSIITLGSKGVCLVEGGSQSLFLAPRDATIVDTTGAGDAFTGAFIAAWLRDADAKVAIGSGLDAAATIVRVAGARPTD